MRVVVTLLVVFVCGVSAVGLAHRDAAPPSSLIEGQETIQTENKKWFFSPSEDKTPQPKAQTSQPTAHTVKPKVNAKPANVNPKPAQPALQKAAPKPEAADHKDTLSAALLERFDSMEAEIADLRKQLAERDAAALVQTTSGNEVTTDATIAPSPEALIAPRIVPASSALAEAGGSTAPSGASAGGQAQTSSAASAVSSEAAPTGLAEAVTLVQPVVEPEQPEATNSVPSPADAASGGSIAPVNPVNAAASSASASGPGQASSAVSETAPTGLAEASVAVSSVAPPATSASDNGTPEANNANTSNASNASNDSNASSDGAAPAASSLAEAGGDVEAPVNAAGVSAVASASSAGSVDAQSSAPDANASADSDAASDANATPSSTDTAAGSFAEAGASAAESLTATASADALTALAAPSTEPCPVCAEPAAPVPCVAPACDCPALSAMVQAAAATTAPVADLGPVAPTNAPAAEADADADADDPACPAMPMEDDASEQLTEEPIIGLFVTPDFDHPLMQKDSLQASYVRWIESAGGRVVPVPFHASHKQLVEIFNSINGLLFPGGVVLNSSPATSTLLELARQANDAGTYFPVWGTCGGFEVMLQDAAGQAPPPLREGEPAPALLASAEYTTAKEDKINSETFEAHGLQVVLNVPPSACANKMFTHTLSGAKKLTQLLGSKPLTFNSHSHGTSPAKFAANIPLSNFYEVVGTSADSNGKEFVSMVAGKRYPFYGTQWHPEKNTLEHGKAADGSKFADIPHSPQAVRVALDFAYFFVNEARRNGHHYENQEAERKALLYGKPTDKSYSPQFVETYTISWPREISEPAAPLTANPFAAAASNTSPSASVQFSTVESTEGW